MLHCAKKNGDVGQWLARRHFLPDLSCSRTASSITCVTRNRREIIVFKHASQGLTLECGAGGTFSSRRLNPGSFPASRSGRRTAGSTLTESASDRLQLHQARPSVDDARRLLWIVPQNFLLLRRGTTGPQSCDSQPLGGGARWGNLIRAGVRDLLGPPNRLHVDIPGALGAGIPCDPLTGTVRLLLSSSQRCGVGAKRPSVSRGRSLDIIPSGRAPCQARFPCHE
jgi:hypothetical protein